MHPTRMCRCKHDDPLRPWCSAPLHVRLALRMHLKEVRGFITRTEFTPDSLGGLWCFQCKGVRAKGNDEDFRCQIRRVQLHALHPMPAGHSLEGIAIHAGKPYRLRMRVQVGSSQRHEWL
eukprot:583845-Pelagomonas_calceolata.AAC.4